jgi:methylmalonyl-CoA/ethylmalonyl-CoA epimerase
MSFTGAFHHVGLACRSIAEEAPAISRLGYRSEGPPIEDPVQKVRVQFFSGAGPRIELIEPAAADSPVSGILKRGTKFYHLAYEVEDIDRAVSELEAASFRPLGAAAPAQAFDMRRIIFMMSATGTMIELIAKS